MMELHCMISHIFYRLNIWAMMKYILYGQNIPVITEEELYLQSLVMSLLSSIP